MTPGLVYHNGKYRPFTGPREINRGRNRGSIEIHLRKLTNTGFIQVKRIVEKTQITRYPK